MAGLPDDEKDTQTAASGPQRVSSAGFYFEAGIQPDSTDLAVAYYRAEDNSWKRHYLYFRSKAIKHETQEKATKVWDEGLDRLNRFSLDPAPKPSYAPEAVELAKRVAGAHWRWNRGWQRLFSHFYGSEDHELIYRSVQDLRLEYEELRQQWHDEYPDLRWFDVMAMGDDAQLPERVKDRLKHERARREKLGEL